MKAKIVGVAFSLLPVVRITPRAAAAQVQVSQAVQHDVSAPLARAARSGCWGSGDYGGTEGNPTQSFADAAGGDKHGSRTANAGEPQAVLTAGFQGLGVGL